MATAGTLLISIRGDSSGAKKAFDDASKSSEHFSATTGKINHRAFSYLGKDMKEAGEAMGGANSQVGSMVEGLGGVTSGVGAATHGYHALHSIIKSATIAQAALNAITPAGWLLIAGGAIAAIGAYLAFSKHVETADEKAKKLKETLGDLANKTGVAFDRAAAQKVKELQGNIEDLTKAQKEYNKTKVAAIDGGVGEMVFSSEIKKAKEELEKFNEAVKKHKQEAAGTKADTELDRLQESVDKIEKSPLRAFKANLEASGRSAKEITESLSKFKSLQIQLDIGQGAKSLKEAQEEFKWADKTKEAKAAAIALNKFLDTGRHEYLHEYQGWNELDAANQLKEEKKQIQEDAKKFWDEELRHLDQMKSKAHSYVEAINPVEKFRDSFQEMKELLHSGLISPDVMSKNLAKERQGLLRGLESQAPNTQWQAHSSGTEAWAEFAKLTQQAEKQDFAKQQLQKLIEQLQLGKSTVEELQQIKSILSGNETIEVN